MNILVVNDDGIHSKGLHILARAAAKMGNVWVVAPDMECSGMSHRITVYGVIDVKAIDIPVDNVKSYSISGTPADCVKIGINQIMPVKPDIVFSGVNNGLNIGYDILYSGTVGAAMEALLNGIPAIAFSKSKESDSYDVVETYLSEIAIDLSRRYIKKNEIWNVNFPSCNLSDYKGILYNRLPVQVPLNKDHYEAFDLKNGNFKVNVRGIKNTQAKPGTDLHAVLNNYISVGTVRSSVIS